LLQRRIADKQHVKRLLAISPDKEQTTASQQIINRYSTVDSSQAKNTNKANVDSRLCPDAQLTLSNSGLYR